MEGDCRHFQYRSVAGRHDERFRFPIARRAHRSLAHVGMAHSRAQVLAAVRAGFGSADATAILAILDQYGGVPHERERDRVHLAILNLSEGDEAKLQYFVAIAKQDYRDVLFWSDCPEEAKIDTPEKRKRIRDMFAKLGIKPPSGLDDACSGTNARVALKIAAASNGRSR
jgi:hypothetical protein